MSFRSSAFRRRTVVKGAILGLAAAGVIALSGCSGSSAASSSAGTSAAADLGDAGIALSWIKNYEFAGYFLADQDGDYTDAGFDEVDLIAGGGSTSSWDTVLAGGATIGLASDLTGVSTSITSGSDLVVIGAQFVKSPVGIVSLSGKPISNLEQLKGKTLGVDAGGKALITAVLKANGLPADTVTFTTVPNGIDPLMDGKVDALVGFLTNYPIAVKQAGGDPVVLSLSDIGYAVIGDAVVVRRDTLQNDREKVKALMAASIEGWNAALKDQDAMVAAALKYGAGNDLTEDGQAASAAVVPSFMITDDTAKHGIFTVSDQLADDAVSALSASGISITKDQLFDPTVLQEVYEEHPDLIPGFTVPAA